MKIFFGAAIQGHTIRGERSEIYRYIGETLKNEGHSMVSEHTMGADFDEVTSLLVSSLGPIPPKGMERTIFIRNKMVEFIEGDIDAAIFEVSTPSLGTGIEIAHAYLRPKMGLKEIPVLALYQKDYWHNNLSSMVKGMTKKETPAFVWKEYADKEELKTAILDFLNSTKT